MLRIVVRLPTRRALVRSKSFAATSQTQRLRNADASLTDKFNLATLNGGKNPFETASERLLRPAAIKPKNDTQMREVYSLEYLLGKKAKVAKETKPKKNPFDVTSAKLM